ncbi:monovalent cation/H(+) antiporter subunit G [Brassicibacter mesophilus]|uniref:monovalent cation/H(+) antiporter subunit G n=1 Tax=Brassicibacter mesophilus TaxID=745119 RepID=UPI003D1E5BEB
MRIILMALLLSGGLFFFIVGTVGLLRFPDTLTRAHSAAKCDTLGAVLCLMSLIVYNGFGYSAAKLLLIILFLWITNPTATHLIAHSIHKKNKK